MRLYQKKIAAEMLKCGVSRIRVLDEKQVSEALTRGDLRNLIRKGLVIKIQKKGTSKFAVRKKKEQKKKGRRKGEGKRKGTWKARNPKKKRWMNIVRPLRKLLRELKVNGQIEQLEYKKIYLKIKGGVFRNKKHMLAYLKEHEMLKERPKKEKTEKKVTKPKKTVKKTKKVKK